MTEGSAVLIPGSTQEMVGDAQPATDLLRRLPPRSVELADLQGDEESRMEEWVSIAFSSREH